MASIEPELLVTLLERHAAPLELYAAQWTSEAADVVQDALIQLARQQPEPENTVAWLYRVVRNGAISAARSHQRRRKREAEIATRNPSWFLASHTNQLDAHEATEALRTLPEEQREVIVARIWGGLSFEEIAEVVDISSSAAHRRYVAGLAALKERLEVPCQTNQNSQAS